MSTNTGKFRCHIKRSKSRFIAKRGATKHLPGAKTKKGLTSKQKKTRRKVKSGASSRHHKTQHKTQHETQDTAQHIETKEEDELDNNQTITMREVAVPDDVKTEDIDMEPQTVPMAHVNMVFEAKPVVDNGVDMDIVTETLNKLQYDIAPSKQFKDFHNQILEYSHYGPRSRNKDNSVFIMPDYDYKNETIKYANFRHVLKLDEWVCNCDRFVYTNNRKYCDHTILAILLTNSNPTKLPFSAYDTSESKFVSETTEGSVMLLQIPDHTRKMAVYSIENNDNRFAFVHINNDFKNIICDQHKGKSSCRHRQLLIDELGEEFRALYKSMSNQPASSTVYWDEEEGFGHHSFLKKEAAKCVSYKRIPVPAVWHTNYDATPESDDYYAATKPRAVPTKLTPNVVQCECGESLSEANEYLKQHEAIIFDLSSSYYVDVYNRRCKHCQNQYVYDGLQDKIFNYNDKILVYHDVFLQYLFLRHRSKTPLNTFVTSESSIYSGNNSITPFFNGVTFGKILAIFQKLQGYHNILRCRTCEKNGKLPDIIGCDASSLLLQKRYIQGVISPKDTTRFNSITPIKMQTKVRRVRDCYIQEPQLRKRVEKLLIDHKIRHYKLDEVKPSGVWRAQDRNSLYRDMKKYGYEKLVNMIKWTLKEKSSMGKQLLLRLGDILRGCTKYILLSHIIPNPIIDPLLEYSVENWMNIRTDINRYQPAIYSVHEQLNKTGVAVPECWLVLIREIAQLSRQSIALKEEIRAGGPPLPAAEEKHQSLFEEYQVSGSCYGYRIHHTRPKYDYDSETKKKKKDKKKKKNVVIYEDNIKVGECNKYFAKFSTMSNGVVIGKCLEHEEMLGFNVMVTPEGLNDYFSLFIMLYPDNTAPKLILGDVACQLERYCMNREPKKFKNSLFLNDEAHSQGHKCGPLYNVKYFKESLSSLVFLNDPSIEQTNRICKNLKTSTMYMKLDTFMRNVCNLLEIESRKSIRKRQSSN